MTLKKFLKYFDSMTEIRVMEFFDDEHGDVLFKGYVFDKGAKNKLKKLYKQNYKLELNEDGCAVMIFNKELSNGAHLPYAQINVKKD